MNSKIEQNIQPIKALVPVLCLALFIGCATQKVSILRESQGTVVQASSHTPGEIWHDPISNMDFCWIPAGTFNMGWPDNWRQTNENKQHRVTISKGFWMGACEVTQGQYQAVMGANPSSFKNVGSNAPVEQVSWNDAQDYLQRLNTKAGASIYRLPTEAEWEYACRAGSTEYRYGDLDTIAWYVGNSDKTTHPVGQKQPNAWGLYDMLGNVWECCQDWYGADYYSSSPNVDPHGPKNGQDRVIRGGSWDCNPDYAYSNLRYPYSPNDRPNFLGIRVVAVAQTP